MKIDRKTARLIIEARRLLLAKVVVFMRDGTQANLIEMERLQARFEQICNFELPIAFRLERVLTRHVLAPAERILARQGVLATAQQMRGWDL